MRNNSCTFAKYCDNYKINKCQGCNRAVDLAPFPSPKNSAVEKMKKDAEKMLEDTIAATLFGRKKTTRKDSAMEIKNVIFNDPATIVLWKDGTKTTVKCQKGDTYSKETGLAVAIAKKALGNKGNFNEVFKKWIPDYVKEDGKEK